MSEAIRADLPDHLQAAHRQFLNTEMVIGTVMSGLVPALVISLLRTPLPMPLLGSHSLASSLIMATLLPGFGLPIGLTLVVRYRVRKGTAPGLGWPLRAPGLARFVPGPLILRGIVSAMAALLVLPAPGLLLMIGLGATTISGQGFVLYNFIHGMALGALVLRPLLTRALADGSYAALARATRSRRQTQASSPRIAAIVSEGASPNSDR